MKIKNFKKCGDKITLDLYTDCDILYGRWESIPVDIFLSMNRCKIYVDDVKEMLYLYS